jgi:hypothetical protein
MGFSPAQCISAAWQRQGAMSGVFDRRAYGPENLCWSVRKDFCNSICQEETHALQQF